MQQLRNVWTNYYDVIPRMFQSESVGRGSSSVVGVPTLETPDQTLGRETR